MFSVIWNGHIKQRFGYSVEGELFQGNTSITAQQLKTWLCSGLGSLLTQPRLTLRTGHPQMHRVSASNVSFLASICQNFLLPSKKLLFGFPLWRIDKLFVSHSVTTLPWTLLITILKPYTTSPSSSCPFSLKPVVYITLNLAKWYKYSTHWPVLFISSLK